MLDWQRVANFAYNLASSILTIAIPKVRWNGKVREETAMPSPKAYRGSGCGLPKDVRGPARGPDAAYLTQTLRDRCHCFLGGRACTAMTAQTTSCPHLMFGSAHAHS